MIAEREKDLVCGMEVDKVTASGTFEYKGKPNIFAALDAEKNLPRILRNTSLTNKKCRISPHRYPDFSRNIIRIE